jgi:transcriptional regulator with XRE-family HTH domain
MVGDELYGRLGRSIAEKRGAKGLSQADLARKVGLSRAAVANVETGRQRIMLHQLYAVASALQLGSILDLVPATWNVGAALPEVEVGGEALSAKEMEVVRGLLNSALSSGRSKRSTK